MRFAIADPPYIGQSKKHYAHHPDYAGEVDHAALIARLVAEFPDGWALCCSSPSLRYLLPLCPESVRVMAWVKPFAFWKPGIRVGYCWEPVIVHGGRPRPKNRGTVRDYIAANAYQNRQQSLVIEKANGTAVPGRKPEAFCFWLFEVLGMERGDELADLFPGSGAVTQAWERYQRQFVGASSSDLVQGVFS